MVSTQACCKQIIGAAQSKTYWRLAKKDFQNHVSDDGLECWKLTLHESHIFPLGVFIDFDVVSAYSILSQSYQPGIKTLIHNNSRYE